MARSEQQRGAIRQALMTGIGSRNEAVVALALDNGADPDILLFEAIRIRDFPWVELAVSRGANVNAQKDDSRGVLTSLGNLVWPALFYAWAHRRDASSNLDLKIMRFLIDKGADVDVDPRQDGTTLLMRSLWANDFATAEFCLLNGADPLRWCNTHGVCPMNYLNGNSNFSEAGKLELLKLMLKKVKERKEASVSQKASIDLSTQREIEAPKPIKLKKPSPPSKGFNL